MSLPPVYIVSATRTPIGGFLGSLSEMAAPKLGAIAIKAAVERAKVAPELINEVFMGNVLSAGIGQAPARQASLGAGLSNKIPCTTVSKVCGSGLQAVVFGARAVALGDAEIVVAGGMESMSNVPYYLKKARTGYRMGNAEMIDGMIFDGLWDPYNDFHMGNAGELCARELKFSREQQDDYAKESFRRALSAQKEGKFADELVSVSVPQKKGDAVLVTEDEGPAKGNPAKMASLKPAFVKDGTITAANAASINDGASALVLASEKAVKEHGLTPLARIVGYGAAAQAPEWFTTAPAVAIDETTKRLGIKKSDIDLYEINEAFAVVAMACAQKCEIDLSRVNVNGGAVALGHPIGASGARILTTLVHSMVSRNAKRGLATLCIGGGEAVAVVIERTLASSRARTETGGTSMRRSSRLRLSACASRTDAFSSGRWRAGRTFPASGPCGSDPPRRRARRSRGPSSWERPPRQRPSPDAARCRATCHPRDQSAPCDRDLG